MLYTNRPTGRGLGGALAGDGGGSGQGWQHWGVGALFSTARSLESPAAAAGSPVTFCKVLQMAFQAPWEEGHPTASSPIHLVLKLEILLPSWAFTLFYSLDS